MFALMSVLMNITYTLTAILRLFVIYGIAHGHNFNNNNGTCVDVILSPATMFLLLIILMLNGYSCSVSTKTYGLNWRKNNTNAAYIYNLGLVISSIKYE